LAASGAIASRKERAPTDDGQFAQSCAGKSPFSFGLGQLIYSGDQLIPSNTEGNAPMSWTTPTLIEVCIGLEINGYLPPEF
jgi:coenzyme PQQ precursor peptide PqqA